MAQLAKVNELFGYDDLSLIEEYATKFGQDANWVYNNVDFGTIIAFAVKWKKEREYNERYQFIWHELHQTPIKK